MFISYAQNFEDVMLWRALKHVNSGFYIDVGAAWPVEHSVTKAFYDSGWSGINVEPNPEFHALLQQERPRDRNLRLALAAEEGNAEFTIFESTGLSTLDPAVAGLHLDTGRPHHMESVVTSTLAQLWRKHVPPEQEVHFLKIDVEGLESAVLRGNHWRKNRPWVVVVEATVPLSQLESYYDWEPLLLEANYRMAYADGLNRFYVAEEHSYLLAAFQYPPNFFDHFKLAEHHAAELRADAAVRVAQQAKAEAAAAQEQVLLANDLAARAQEQAQMANERAAQAQALVQQAQKNVAQAQRDAAQAQENARRHEQQKMASELLAVSLQEQITALQISRAPRLPSRLRTTLEYFRQSTKK